jgi:hypothetical protein
MSKHPVMKNVARMMVHLVIASIVILIVITPRAHAQEKDKADSQWVQCVKWMKARKMPDSEKRCTWMAEFRKNLADSEKLKHAASALQ